MTLRILGLMAVYYPGVFSLLTGLPLSSGRAYVGRGSDITDCSTKCPLADGVLELYRECGGEESRILEIWCDNMWLHNRYQPRLLYNTSTGCWRLRDAGKNDSCVYNVVYYGNNGRFLTKLPITVLDPVLISNITSNSSRPGEDIAVSVQYSGEETAVTWEVDGGLLPDRFQLTDDNRTVIIPRAQRDDAERKLRIQITNPVSEAIREYQLEITDPEFSGSFHKGYVAAVIVFPVVVVIVVCIAVLVKRRCRRKIVTEDPERRTEESGGRNSSSQTDRPGEKRSLLRILKTWGKMRNPEYEATPQRDVEMTDVPSVPAS